MKLFDTHTHVNFKDFNADQDEVMRRAAEGGVALVNVGTDYDTSRAAVELAEKHEGVWASVGLHPNDFYLEKGFYSDFAADKFKKLAEHKKVVAVGETGLDFYRTKKEDDQKAQRENFLKQIEMASALKKTLIIHCRDAYPQTYEILKARRPRLVEVVVHSFTGAWADAKNFLDLGCFIAFNGIITFARNYDKTVKSAPLNQIVLETDAPFLTPAPHRGRRNEPSYVKYVAEKLAEIRGLSLEETAVVTSQNAFKLYQLDHA